MFCKTARETTSMTQINRAQVTDKDEWFEEICIVCSEPKMVHDTPNCSYENPTFICRECENLSGGM